MEKYALDHLAELYLRSLTRGIICPTLFYSEEELDEALSFLKGRFGKTIDNEAIHLFGGHLDSDRKRIVFAHDIEVNEEDYVGAMKLESRNISFQGFVHREVLGSLIGLGIKRALVGDILINGKETYVYYAKEAEETFLSLGKVSRENVEAKSIEISQVPIITTTETRSFSLTSLRLDTLLAHVYSLSREEAKEAIGKGLVKVSQTIVTKNDYVPKEGERISLKGKGKFRYIGEKGISKKGKLVVEIEIYL